jgi:hypothetical protein
MRICRGHIVNNRNRRRKPMCPKSRNAGFGLTLAIALFALIVLIVLLLCTSLRNCYADCVKQAVQIDGLFSGALPYGVSYDEMTKSLYFGIFLKAAMFDMEDSIKSNDY